MKKKEEILEEKMNELVNIYVNNHNIVNWRRSKYKEINNTRRRWINCKEEEEKEVTKANLKFMKISWDFLYCYTDLKYFYVSLYSSKLT